MFSYILGSCRRWQAAIVVILLGFQLPLKAQGLTDTLRLPLPEMEKRFLDSNLLLLAAHYNVDAQKALIEQARLWDNPVLNTDQVIAAGGRFLPYGKNADGSYTGQYYIQLQQLIRTAGKRGKLIGLASTNAKLSELQLQDVLRNLRYQLHTDYYNLVQQLETRHIYEAQLEQLNKLLSGMEAQLSAGNIAQKDYLRIQGLGISLQQDITELDRNITENESDLRTLLQIRTDVFVKPATGFTGPGEGSLTDQDLLFQSAKQNNPAYLLQQAQVVYQQQNLAYQRSLRVPDITVGPNFDRNSSFAPNYIGLGISLPIPLLNKNQGNIRSAEYSIRQQQSITANAETELRNNLGNAFHKWQLSLQQDNAVQKSFYARYRDMYRNILQSYQQKQIGLLEFLDFFNDYTASQQRLLQQHLNLQLAKEELNYHAGSDLIK
ncbi:MAG: TolC family protein [Chitinophagaceae bacterium]|nr:TolC family protein [Chitinophagaceae bacterium]